MFEIAETVESIQARADRESRQAHDFIYYNPIANAAEIAQSVDEPAELLEKIIKAVYQRDTSSVGRYLAVHELVRGAVRTYANDQAEAAANHVMNTPA